MYEVQPTLISQRLMLRPFMMADAPRVQELANDPEIASTTLAIPYPYPDGKAEEWIACQGFRYDRRREVVFAILLRATEELIGSVSLTLDRNQYHAELGYWLGKKYWNYGYCTEAVGAIVQFGFQGLALHRIYGRHMVRNPASGRVMQKLGLVYEGCLRGHVWKWGQFEDIAIYGILCTDNAAKQSFCSIVAVDSPDAEI